MRFWFPLFESLISMLYEIEQTKDYKPLMNAEILSEY